MNDETNALLRDIVLLNFIIAALLFIVVSYFAGNMYKKHRGSRSDYQDRIDRLNKDRKDLYDNR